MKVKQPKDFYYNWQMKYHSQVDIPDCPNSSGTRYYIGIDVVPLDYTDEAERVFLTVSYGNTEIVRIEIYDRSKITEMVEMLSSIPFAIQQANKAHKAL